MSDIDGANRSCLEGVERLKARIFESYPHPNVFTEGFLYRDGNVYESFGPQGEGGLIRYALGESVPALRYNVRDSSIFPEGLAWRGDELIQLTEKSKLAFVYDAQTLERTGAIQFEGTGWGLASNDRSMIRSDGSERIYFHDPKTFVLTESISVTEGGKAVKNLNELEWVESSDSPGGGWIYANLWFKDQIDVIDPQTGRVTQTIDTTALSASETRRSSDSVINGIAFRPETQRLLLTGKRWAHIYEVALDSVDCTP